MKWLVFAVLVVLAVVATDVQGRAVPSDSTSTEVLKDGPIDRCYAFGEWTHYCLVVTDLVRIAVDIPRTIGVLEDFALLVGFRVLDLLTHPEYLGEAIQAFVAVQLDAVFWVPKFVWGVIDSVLDGSKGFLRFIEHLTKLHFRDQIKILIQEPIYYIQKLLKGTWSGLKAGLELSGAKPILAWVEGLEKMFNQYVLAPIMHFLDMFGGAMKCTNFLPKFMCDKIHLVLRLADDLYVHLWGDFWDFINGPSWGITNYLRELIRPIIKFIDEIPQKLEAFCEKRSACTKFVKTIQTIDKFARQEVVKGMELVKWAIYWLKKELMPDVKKVGPAAPTWHHDHWPIWDH